MAKDRLYEFNGQKGHWYTDEQGNRYFVAQGQTPKEGWEATKSRKMIKGGKYVKDDGDDKGEQEISADEYRTYEADEEERFDETTDADFEDDEPEGFDRDDDDERSWGPDQPEDEIWAKFDEWKEYAFSEDQTPENIEKGNKLSEEWSEELYDYMTDDQKKEFERIYDTADPDELENFVANVIGNRRNGRGPDETKNEEPLFDESGLSTEKGIEEAKNFLDAKGVKDPYALNNEQFNALADEAAKKYGIDRALAQEFLVAPFDEEKQPKEGSPAESAATNREAKDEKEAQPDGYYKDDDGKIYMTKGGKDYYPVGEEEERDFVRAFNNQNKEKAKEMANDPETAKSFERIHADLVKGFEETYKREPTQEEKDAIRDIARLQTALVAMARKK